MSFCSVPVAGKSEPASPPERQLFLPEVTSTVCRPLMWIASELATYRSWWFVNAAAVLAVYLASAVPAQTSPKGTRGPQGLRICKWVFPRNNGNGLPKTLTSKRPPDHGA
jgi:hypothetical protein